MLTKHGLVNVLEDCFGSKFLPPTQKTEKEAIDHIYCTPEMMRCIKQVGIAPLHTLTYSDHRPIFLDLDVKNLFKDINRDDI